MAKKKVISRGKRSIIAAQLEEYDISNVEYIRDALKDCLDESCLEHRQYCQL